MPKIKIPQSQIVKGIDGISSTINATQPSIHAILTPDRAEKRQNGRRMKDEGEPSFTLTGQDVHGVMIIRGRPRYNEKEERSLKYYKYKDACPTISQNCASGDQKNIVAISNKSPREFKWQTERSPALQARDYKDPKLVNKDMKIRRLIPTECERLQGFPDFWTEGFSDTQRYKMMGNAVTVNVVKAIANKLFAKTGLNETGGKQNG